MSKTRSTNRTSPRQSTLKTRHRNGYAEFFDENTRRWESTHRRTLAKRIGEDNLDGMQVHHIDGNKLNNTPLNPVPLLLVDNVTGGRLGLKSIEKAGLSNLAATVANLLGLEKHPAWDDSLLEVRGGA